MKRDFLALLIIFLAAITISLPLVESGLHLIHDDQQIARLFLFDQALRSGQLPVRWVDSLGFGFGYPLFVFYPPLVYIMGEIYHLVGFGFIDSVKMVFFSSILFSGFAMYFFVKEFWGKYAAVVASIFYLLVPYRALDIYVRGALAESFSFVWLPLILWSFYRLQKTGKFSYVHVAAFFLALLMITHNLIFLPFMLIIPFYLLFLIWKSDNKKSFFSQCLLSVVLSFGLSAFFWLPAILEKKFTIVDQLLLVGLADYKIHFVYPQQLWNWPWGFGGSAAGLADGISFKIGKLHILVSLAAAVMAAIHLIKNRRSVNLSLVVFALFLFSAFMTTFYSKPIWDLIPPLSYLQFPWRFLIFSALFSSILAGAFVYFLRLPILKLFVASLLIILVFIPNFKLFKPQTYRSDLSDEIATSKEFINWDVSQSSFEYLPRGVELVKSDLDTNVVNIQKSELPKQKVEILSGQAQITDLKTTSSRVKFGIDAKEMSKIRINIFNFPVWKAKINGESVQIQDNNKFKLITFDVPVGLQDVEVEFNNTRIRTLANSVSIFSLVLLLLFLKKWRIQATS